MDASSQCKRAGRRVKGAMVSRSNPTWPTRCRRARWSCSATAKPLAHELTFGNIYFHSTLLPSISELSKPFTRKSAGLFFLFLSGRLPMFVHRRHSGGGRAVSGLPTCTALLRAGGLAAQHVAAAPAGLRGRLRRRQPAVASCLVRVAWRQG